MPQTSALQIFAIFLRLGLTSFGGPAAHLGYFRDEFVQRRGWLDDAAYADLVTLCQFLPGPSSSQTGFALGMLRGGWPGAVAAFLGFTLPSALLMFALAAGAGAMTGPGWAGMLHGLKLAAVAIVAQAVLGMARSLCPDRARATIAVLAVLLGAVLPGAIGMVAGIAAGAVAGLALGRGPGGGAARPLSAPIARPLAFGALGLCAGLLLGLPLLAPLTPALALFDSFFRAGALVFGGGHVVLPLLAAEVVQPGLIAPDTFLAGYGSAQALPGPLFSLAAYLGALTPPGGAAGAMLALTAIFLPGFLLLVGLLPLWERLRALAPAQALMQGANAAVVGILGAALYAIAAEIRSPVEFGLVLLALVLLAGWRAPPWAVVAAAALAGALLA